MQASPATVRYPLKDIKLLLVNDKEKCCSYWMYPLINSGGAWMVDMVRKFRPEVKWSGSIYTQVRNHCLALERLGYVKLSYPEKVDWEATNAARMEEIKNSVQDIFAAAVRKDPPPFVSSGTSPREAQQEISTVKIRENRLYVVPTEQLFALINRVQNSNHFLNVAKSRRQMSELLEKVRPKFAKSKLQRKHCPYYVSAGTKQERLDAIFKMHGIRQHRMFKRRDKKHVNEELTRGLNPVQMNFEKYLGGIEGKQIMLRNKENGELKFLDYQTRFTDEDRKKGTVARYHGVWETAGTGFNSAVMLTLTSYPPSEAPKHQHRSSLFHVDRHFGSAWNAFMSKLTKRNKAIRRDELLDLKREEVEKTRAVTLETERCWHCEGKGTVPGVTRATKTRTCPRCKGSKYLLKIKLTKEERKEALLPLKLEYQIGEKVRKIRETESRLILTDEEYVECQEEIEFRPRYLSVYEFQKNGLLHSHTVIFGKSYLAYWEDIALDWMKTGQGERIHVYGIQKQGDTWEWLKGNQPKDARNKKPVDYLGKYLAKGVKEKSWYGLYWTINKRWFTNSRALAECRVLPDMTEDIPSYEYLGTTHFSEIPPWLNTILSGRKKSPARIGAFDPLGWGGDTGPGVPA